MGKAINRKEQVISRTDELKEEEYVRGRKEKTGWYAGT
jgi:hypothetical protein